MPAPVNIDEVLPPLTFMCEIRNGATNCDAASNSVEVYFDVLPEVKPTANSIEQGTAGEIKPGDIVVVECEGDSGSQPTTLLSSRGPSSSST